MSLINSLLGKIIKNNCDHNNQLNDFKESSHMRYFFCYKCNNIILIDKNRFYSTYKLFPDKEDIQIKNEFDPVTAVRLMIQRQDEEIRDINEKLVLNFSNNDESNTNNPVESNICNDSEKITNSEMTYPNNDETMKEKIKNIKSINSGLYSRNNSNFKKKLTKMIFDEGTFEKYIKQRNKILIYIHKLCTKLQYNDSSFYLTLNLVDTYLSRIFSDEITERELFLVVLGFFWLLLNTLKMIYLNQNYKYFAILKKKLL